MSVCSGVVGDPDNPFVLTAKHCVDAANLVSLTMLGCGVGQWSQTNHLGRPVSNSCCKCTARTPMCPMSCTYTRMPAMSANEMFRDRVILHSFPSKVPQAAGRAPRAITPSQKTRKM